MDIRSYWKKETFHEVFLYVRLIELLILAEEWWIPSRPTIILDNARIHFAELYRRVLSKLQWEIQFIAPYCPETAPIEWAFGTIKSKLKRSTISRIINFDEKNDIYLILQMIAQIKFSSWQNVWIKVIKEAKRTLINCKILQHGFGHQQ